MIIDKEGVIFQNADETNEHPVIIHAAYYSSNTWDTDGTYLPQDKFDLGTNECATVLVRASGKGFSARGSRMTTTSKVMGTQEKMIKHPR